MTPDPEREMDETEDHWTLCTECGAQFGPDEEGYDYDECIECGGYCHDV